DEARRIVSDYVAHYNEVRLHSAIGYVTPKDKLEGRDQEILAARDRKLAEARERRKQQRQAAYEQRPAPASAPRPLHGSTSGTSRCFAANLDSHTFQYFKCGKSGNALDLWAAATQQSLYDA